MRKGLLFQKGLMPLPGRTSGNDRNYSDAHRERLLFIRHCRGIGINLDEINQLLECRDHPVGSCQQVNDMIDGMSASIEKDFSATRI